MDPFPPFMQVERDAIIAEVYEAFAGVTRKGGVSWTESDEVDNYGSTEARAAARAKDRDTSWMQVVDDPNWQGSTGIGGWCFLDAIGFRYYLPVALVRYLRPGVESVEIEILFSLTRSEGELERYSHDQWSLLNGRQRRCVKRFLQYMDVFEKIAFADSTGWANAYEGYWKDVPDEDEPTIARVRRHKLKTKPPF